MGCFVLARPNRDWEGIRRKLPTLSRITRFVRLTRQQILIAVHGEALLPFLWMSRSPASSIIELGSAEKEDDLHEDYAWAASALNISAYSFYGSG